jgi:hypothetical protein
VMCGITVPIVGDTDRSSDELAGVSIFFLMSNLSLGDIPKLLD